MRVYSCFHYINHRQYIYELNPEVVLTYKLQGKPIFHTVLLAYHKGITKHELIKRRIPYAMMENPHLRIMDQDVELYV